MVIILAHPNYGKIRTLIAKLLGKGGGAHTTTTTTTVDEK